MPMNNTTEGIHPAGCSDSANLLESFHAQNQLQVSEKSSEEEGLFKWADMFWVEQMKETIGRKQNSIDRILELALRTPPEKLSVREAQIAFAFIGHSLKRNPFRKAFRNYNLYTNQITDEWLTFRRLFLRICREPIPEEFLCPLFSRTGVIKLPYGQEEQVSGFEQDFTNLERITRIRLAYLERVNRQSVLDSFAESGNLLCTPECGVFHVIKEQILAYPRKYDRTLSYLLGFLEPDPLRIPENEPSLTNFLRSITDKVKRKSDSSDERKSDFSDELKSAIRSARAVLFESAEIETFGKSEFTQSNRSLERHYLRLLINDPEMLGRDPDMFDWLVDGLATDASKLLQKLSEYSKTAEGRHQKKRTSGVGSDQMVSSESLRRETARLWVDPDLPLWLMTNSAMISVLQVVTNRHVSENQIRELYKNRSNSQKLSLTRSSSRSLITHAIVKWQNDELELTEIGFTRKIKGSGLFSALREYLGPHIKIV